MSAKFEASSTSYKGCPKTQKPEYAFIGRSNVGKSSLINMLAGSKNLAKTSQTPGKTQLINHFLFDDAWYLVDLPGYGFAKVSKQEKELWHKMIKNYLQHRENLLNTFVLIDIRLEPQAIDLEFFEWMGTQQLPFAIVFTKTDKLSSTQLQKNIQQYTQEMLKTWEELPDYFLSSAIKHLGREEILSYIKAINEAYAKQL